MIEWAPYAYQTRRSGVIDAQRGTLRVAMNRRPGGASGDVVLSLVKLPATAERSGDPVLFLAGGPGDSGIDAGRGRSSELFQRLRETSDVILLDQRGSGASTPSLGCEPLALPPGAVLTRRAVLQSALAHATENAARLRGAGVDLDAFNTLESAADVRDLVGALGAGRVHLVGTSYGTHLAMAVLKYHPGVVASVVLAGPEGPDHTYKLPSNVRAQLEQVAERSGDRDFVALVAAVLDELERRPLPVVLPDPDGGEPVEMPIGRFDVEYIASSGAADTRIIALMPGWFANLAAGDTSDFRRYPLLARYLFYLRRGLFTSAMGPCMDCASGATAQRWARIEREAEACVLGRTIDFPFPEIAEAWNVPDLGDEFRAAPQNPDIPVLFITGTWDCRTPEGNVRDLAPGLGNYQHLVIEDAGHMDLLAGAEVAERIMRFIAGKTVDGDRIAADSAFTFERHS